AGFRYLAEEMGLRYTKDDGMFVHSGWLDSQPALGKYLDVYTDRQTGRSTTVDVRRSLNRYSLGAIVDYFIAHDPDWAAFESTVERLHAFSGVAELRNKGLAGHGFNGIGVEDVKEKYGAPPDEMLEALKTIYHGLFDKPPGEDPYHAVNELLVEIIEASS